MKKALLIFVILLATSLTWYFYTIDEVKSKANAHEEIQDYQRALKYYKKYSELTNDNLEYAEKLVEIASKQLNDKDYKNAESNFNEYQKMKLKGGWFFGSVDTTVLNQHDWNIKLLPNEYIKIYENTGRLDEELKLYLNNKKDLITHACMNCFIEDLGLYYIKSFNLSYKLNKLDTAFNIYLDYIFRMATIDDDDAIDKVIRNKISRYNNTQKDSILKAAFDSFIVEVSQNKDYNSFRTNFEIFGKRIPDPNEIGPRPILDSNINITDITYMINYDWERFKRTRLYELLAERK